MIYIDLIIIVVIIYAFIKGFYNGLINEIASFLGLFIGAIVSYTFSDNLSEILNSYFEIDPKVLNILSFILLLVTRTISLNKLDSIALSIECIKRGLFL